MLPMVFVSLTISWIIKSSFLPTGSSDARVSMKFAMCPFSRTISSAISRRSMYTASSCRILVSSMDAVFAVSMILSRNLSSCILIVWGHCSSIAAILHTMASALAVRSCLTRFPSLSLSWLSWTISFSKDCMSISSLMLLFSSYEKMSLKLKTLSTVRSPFMAYFSFKVFIISTYCARTFSFIFWMPDCSFVRSHFIVTSTFPLLI